MLKSHTLEMRKNILKLAHKAGANGAHIAPALSIVEILATLYLSKMSKIDYFVLSKGHGALGMYVALYEAGIISKEQLYSYEENGGDFPGQPPKNISAGINFASGSLGMGLSYGAGLALSHKLTNTHSHIYVLMGDGELNEGTVWESAFFASHYKLNNLVAIIDRNSLQSDGTTKDIMDLDISSLWKACKWSVLDCNGHDCEQLYTALNTYTESPKVIIADTTKGKGVNFMENNNQWHHSRLSESQLREALNSIEQQ